MTWYRSFTRRCATLTVSQRSTPCSGRWPTPGRLLVVGHAPLDPEWTRAHGFEVTHFIQRNDIANELDGEWEVEACETRLRFDLTPEGSPFTHDTVLRVRRR